MWIQDDDTKVLYNMQDVRKVYYFTSHGKWCVVLLYNNGDEANLEVMDTEQKAIDCVNYICRILGGKIF